MLFSSSYSQDMQEVLTLIAAVARPTRVLEIGTQQGTSAIALSKGMPRGSSLWTWDLFEEKYRLPPFGNTHANLEEAKKNLDLYGKKDVNKHVHQGDYFSAWEELVFKGGIQIFDLIHIDICNHYDNLRPILKHLIVEQGFIAKTIILEGGKENHWQKQCGFRPYFLLFQEGWISNWSSLTLVEDDNHALTILTQK